MSVSIYRIHGYRVQSRAIHQLSDAFMGVVRRLDVEKPSLDRGGVAEYFHEIVENAGIFLNANSVRTSTHSLPTSVRVDACLPS